MPSIVLEKLMPDMRSFSCSLLAPATRGSLAWFLVLFWLSLVAVRVVDTLKEQPTARCSTASRQQSSPARVVSRQSLSSVRAKAQVDNVRVVTDAAPMHVRLVRCRYNRYAKHSPHIYIYIGDGSARHQGVLTCCIVHIIQSTNGPTNQCSWVFWVLGYLWSSAAPPNPDPSHYN